MKTAIVIGGGIAGCSTAYALFQRGITVTLIERHAVLAQEASGNPIAMLYPKLSIKPSLADQLTLQGFKFTLDLLKKTASTNLIFQACGLIQLAFNTREQAKQNSLMQVSEYQSLLKQLTREEAGKIAGLPLNAGGLFISEAGWIKPAAFCDALTNSNQMTKITSTNALKIEKIKQGWEVIINNNQRLNAEIVVICNANDMKQFKQCASVAITPVRGQINFFAKNAISQSIKTIICSDHFVSPAVDGFHSIGTSYAPNDFNSALSNTDTHENIQALRKISMPLFECLHDTKLNGRVAWRSATLDYMPLAGQLLDGPAIRANPPRYNAQPANLPWLEGLYVNAGHGSKGMITAPICGELIAGLACNDALSLDAKLASKLNPSRFLLRELGLKQLAQTLYH